MPLSINAISCLQDNYAYLVTCRETGATAVVDPGEAGPVLAALQQRGLELSAILATHHHWDHIAGTQQLLEAFPGASVYGHVSDRGRIERQSRFLEAGEAFTIGRQQAVALHVPGHTTGALAYHFEGHVFSGDTLFGGGCGRLFEGTAEMMYRSLNTLLAGLPESTRVYFGHEYTLTNLRFARLMEPGNAGLEARLDACEEARARGAFTTPSTIGVERATNPFLRCDSDEIRETLRKYHEHDTANKVETFAAIRRAKDQLP